MKPTRKKLQVKTLDPAAMRDASGGGVRMLYGGVYCDTCGRSAPRASAFSQCPYCGDGTDYP